MKPYFLLLVASILFSCAQKDAAKRTTLKQASEYFPKEKAKVLVVGLFHFVFLDWTHVKLVTRIKLMF